MSNYLSAADLADMAAQQSALMPDTCTILLPGTARTAQGGVAETEGTVATAQPCRFRVVQPNREAVAGGAVLPEPSYILTLPSSVSLTERHVIVIGTTRYNVQSVNNAVSWRTATRAELVPLKARPL